MPGTGIIRVTGLQYLGFEALRHAREMRVRARCVVISEVLHGVVLFEHFSGMYGSNIYNT
jgi:hypothetical protein